MQSKNKCANITDIKNAMKETLTEENDRKTASPTESAVSGRRYREHSGAGYLNRKLIRAARGHALNAREGRRGISLMEDTASMRVVPRMCMSIRPGIQETVFRDFLFYGKKIS
ncbi:MAG: hypothetical protein ACI4HQ_06365 [Acetatifactor sp.]